MTIRKTLLRYVRRQKSPRLPLYVRGNFNAPDTTPGSTNTANTKPAVLVNVFRQPDSNTVAVAEAVHQEIENIRRALPPFLRHAQRCRAAVTLA